MVCMPILDEDENSDMELINIEHHILFHSVHNDTLMVPRRPKAPKSELLTKRMT